MARSTDEIIATMDAEQASQPDLAPLNSQSQTAIYRLFKYVVAQCQNLLESLMDKKIAEIEAVFDRGIPPSTAWVRQKSFEFQYDATIPQVMQLVNLVPTYITVDPTKRIITRCCVGTIAGAVSVFVAKNEPPEKLTVAELASFQDYFINSGNGTDQAVGIGWGGQSITCYSEDPGLVFFEAEIKYNGKFASTFPDECILAMENYISNLGQNPIMRTGSLVDAIQSVTGYVDVFIHNLGCRDSIVPFGSKTDLVGSDVTLLTEFTSSAGYMIPETDTGNTWADKITFTAV